MIVFAIYWLIQAKYRWILLLLASYFFYGFWEVSYLPLILFSTAVDYFLSRYLTSSEERFKKKVGLYASLVLNLGLLFIFKYYNFFQSSTEYCLSLFDVQYDYNESSLLLPVGISFYTFQTLSYSIDVYRKKIKPERHYGKFSLFVAFFPQLVAGPIERASELLPQLRTLDVHLKSNDVKEGLLLITYGLFKKVVVADNCGLLVDTYYQNYEVQNGGTMLFATYLFAIQIYADFSGYSNIAIGLGKLMGIKLNTNFNTPFFSDSLSAYWRNWHISLSNWIRDYIYIPLGGNRKGAVRTSINLFLTLTIAGLWHGAAVTYVIWGMLNGLYLVFEKIIGWNNNRERSKVSYVLRAIVTFHVVLVLWFLFRSESLTQATTITWKVFNMSFYDFYFICGDNKFTPAVIASVLFIFIEFLIPFKPITSIMERGVILRYSIYTGLVMMILLLGNSSASPFIYFQF